MNARAINVHSFPGRPSAVRQRTGRRRRAERFGDRNGLILVAVAERYAMPERWGLGLALRVVGPTVGGAVLIAHDDLEPARREALEQWAAGTRLRTPGGRQPVEVVTRSPFLDPDTGLFTRRVYVGAGSCVTADEGRSFGLLADWWRPATDPFWRGGVSMGLPGWGVVEDRLDDDGRDHSGWRPSLHRPVLRAKAIGPHGVIARFGKAGRNGRTPTGEPAGRWERDPATGRYGPSMGHLIDLIGPAHAFDGIDTGDLREHLAAFGLPPLEVPAQIPVDPAGAQQLLDVALGVHQLALALDREAALWCTTPEDRREGRAAVGLGSVYSPGGVAAHIMRRSGITPPLRKFAKPDDALLDGWASAAHGGWQTADVRGVVVPVVDADVRSAYPAGWALLDCWRVLRAKRLHQVDVLPTVQRLAERAAAGDLAPLFDRRTYSRLGLTLCQVQLNRETAPVELPIEGGDPHFVVAPVQSSTPMWLTWPDVILSALLSRRVPRLLSATRLRPEDEEQVRPVPLRDGTVVPPGEDPWVAAVRLRAEAKAAGDVRLKDVLRVVASSAWGNSARGDQHRRSGGKGRRSKLVERPAEWSWPPIAATVPAVSRMWLAVIDRLVSDAEGAIVTRDTDGLAILAAPEEDKLALPDGRVVRVLSWHEVVEMLAPFDRLNPFDDGRPFFETERGRDDRPLHLLSLAPKRYVKALPDDGGGFEVTGGTEHSLGGDVVGPPNMAGRDAARRHLWTYPVAQHALDRALGGGQIRLFSAPWDAGRAEPWPVLRRFQAATPKTLEELPKVLGAHPFAPVVEAETDRLWHPNHRLAGAPLALDPGTDLSDWPHLSWTDRRSRPLTLTTDPHRVNEVVLGPLSDMAEGWAIPVPVDDPCEVDVAVIRRVGRGGALVDARLANPEASVEDHLVVIDDGDPATFVRHEVERLGPAAFSRTYGVPLNTAKGIGLRGKTPGGPTIRRVMRALMCGDGVTPTTCALAGCEEPVLLREGARYCSDRHQRVAKERRRRARMRGAGR
jgi:hypothetical protein